MRNFDRRFIKTTGNTPLEYWQRVKVEAAKSNLEKGRKSIFEVMYEVGYSDDKAFREVFKKITVYLLWITERNLIRKLSFNRG